MKTIICSLNSAYIHSSLAPWYLLSGMRQKHPATDAEVVEGTVNEPIDTVMTRILNKSPDIVGIGCYIWNITRALELARVLKEYGVIIILGGPEVSYRSADILHEYSYIDYVLAGEGDFSFADLADAIENHNITHLHYIGGLAFRDNDKTIANEPYIGCPETDPPNPYLPEYFIAQNGRISYIETSRGCPFTCAFCLSGRCGGVRYFNLNEVKQNILSVANSGTHTVKFVDRTFNANPKRAYELISFIIDNYGAAIPDTVCFHFEIAGDILTDELLELFASAPEGAIQLEIGVQSFNQRTLEAINRKTDFEKLTHNIKRIIGCGNIHLHLDLIAGLPFEDTASFKNSFNAAYSLHSHMLQLGFLKLLFGAPMREHPQQYPCEYSNKPPYEVISTPWMTSGELEHLHYTEDALDRLYNSRRFKRTIDYLINALDITPYDFFTNVGSLMIPKRISLDEYSHFIFEYFNTLKKVNSDKLLNCMICDRLATNSDPRLPSFMRVSAPELKKLLPDNRHMYVMLHGEKTAVSVDKEKGKGRVNGEYCLIFTKIDS